MHGDTDGAGEHDLLACDLDRRTQRAANALGVSGELGDGLLGQEQDGEAITADARQRIVGSDMALQATGNGQQETVAEHEAERRVRVLELVDVDGDDGGADLRFRFGAHHCHLQTIEHQLLVRESRQAAMDGVV